jgi:hypothetical protein
VPVEDALSIARFTAADDCAGLPMPLLAKDFRDLDLFHPWDLPVERAIELARRCEDAAFATSPDWSAIPKAVVSRPAIAIHFRQQPRLHGGLCEHAPVHQLFGHRRRRRRHAA